jgi:hypothetical protein
MDAATKTFRDYKVFCWVTAVINFALSIGCTFLPDSFQVGEIPVVIGGFKPVLVVAGLVLAGANALFPLLPKTAWAYGIHLAVLYMNAPTIIWTAWAMPIAKRFREPDVMLLFGIRP